MMSSRAVPRSCRKCKIHGEDSLHKGHKKSCPYQNCKCRQCLELDRKNSLQKEMYKNTDVVEENIGTSSCLDVVKAANVVHNAQIGNKQKTPRERKQEQIQERNTKRAELYHRANDILCAMPPELKDRSPVLNLARAYKLASQQQKSSPNSIFLAPIHGRLNECLTKTNYNTFPPSNSQEVDTTEALMHAAAADILHDIYPNQDRGLIESILGSFNHDVVKAANWLTEVFGGTSSVTRNTAIVHSQVATAETSVCLPGDQWNESISNPTNKFGVNDFSSDNFNMADESNNFLDLLTETPPGTPPAVDVVTVNPSVNELMPSLFDLPVAATAIEDLLAAKPALSTTGIGISQANDKRNLFFSKQQSKQGTSGENSAPRRRLFSIENLISSGSPGPKTFSGHKYYVDEHQKENADRDPVCLSFSRTPVDELLQMKDKLLSTHGEKIMTSSKGFKRRNGGDKLCRVCGLMSSELFCPNCGNLLNKRGRY